MTIDASLDKRLEKVVRTHNKMRRNGVVHRVGRDGLIRSRPRLIRPRFPLKGALIMVGLLIAFKSLMFAQIGSGNYALKVEELRQGTMVEQAGAVLMQEEPITVATGGFLKQFFFQR
ncbi:hypothetical protein Q4555_14775 [Octadecabacter sp. 1_MG-2023]|uniref:hypothetical protein n=1 Tax=unclassified Octadecabacter TaxID=196158 RepID=UPI001C0A4946|nr:MULTISPECIES: hypothetical protein [unclassified Octadecabacter]MBU2991966.1 hypothetical protein [Octadecabacter sp. B2R22]MDO6735940.1 hypothetical protein [Octadecabacter sp. 1_MG-2023]